MKTAVKIALIALLWISVITSGVLGVDTELRLQMAHAWWTGTEEVSTDMDLSFSVPGRGGERYIFYEVGQSLLMLPSDWLGTQLHQWFPAIDSRELRLIVVSIATFIPLNVAAVVACFWLLRLFNFEKRIAGLASIVWLLGTTFLPYAQMPFQNNQVLLFAIIGYAAALAFVRSRQLRFAVLSGLAISTAPLIRLTSIIHVLTVLLFFVGCMAYQSRDKLKVIRSVGLWIVGFLPLALLGRAIDYIRYGGFWVSGQSLHSQQQAPNSINYFVNPPHVGILGVLFSPAKSIFIYDPLLLPCLVLGIVLWKRLSPFIQWYLVTGLLNLSLHMVITSRLAFWHGDAAWAARYHVTSVHLLLIPLVALFVQHLLSTRGITTWLMRGILTLAILVQFASVAMPITLEVAQEQTSSSGSSPPFRLGTRLTNMACLINSSFSTQCVENLIVSPELEDSKKAELKDLNRINFLPFVIAQKSVGRSGIAKIVPILFAVWGAILALAIWLTVKFCFVLTDFASYGKKHRDRAQF